TSTPRGAHGPEPSASTNSATSAGAGQCSRALAALRSDSGDGALELADVAGEVALALRQPPVALRELFGEPVELVGLQLELRTEAGLAQAQLVAPLLDLGGVLRQLEFALLGVFQPTVELRSKRRELSLALRNLLRARVRGLCVHLARRYRLSERALAQLERFFAPFQLGHQGEGLLRRATVPRTFALGA